MLHRTFSSYILYTAEEGIILRLGAQPPDPRRQGGGIPSPASDSVGFQTVRIYARLDKQIGVRWVVRKANEPKARRNKRSEWRTP